MSTKPGSSASARRRTPRSRTRLDTCIFPAEARLADEAFATQAAGEFVVRRAAVGTTAAMVFGSAFPAAQDALFRAHATAGLRLGSGRGTQTQGPASAAPLMTDEDRAVELVADEIARWHGRDADLVLVDVDRCPPLARRLAHGSWPEDPAEADVARLFTLLMELEESAIHTVLVRGHEVVPRRLG